MAEAQAETIFQRMIRSSALVAGSYLASQVLRLASNLILTRLLYPEAFGLMALVTMVLVGLAMFSDVGLGPAIQSHPRGDDPEFLNTAFTLQMLRGWLLAMVALGLALPMARIYDAPELLQILPVAGLQMIIAGMNPTRIETANRHLRPGPVMIADLAAQALSLGVMVVLALWTGSVWALVWGALAGAVLKLVFCYLWLPGHRDRIGWDRAVGQVLLQYGSWILLSTAFSFLLLQGDKAILGLYLSLDALGIYNVGYFLASFPIFLAGAVTGRLLVPLYAQTRQDSTASGRLSRMRYGLTGILFSMIVVLALGGPVMVDLLYDGRYAAAGAVVTGVALAQIPQMLVISLDPAALAFGRSRAYFAVTAIRASLQTVFLVAGAHFAGLAGALAGQLLAGLLSLPLSLRLARRNGILNLRHDLIFLALSALLVVAALLIWPEFPRALAAL